MRVKTSRREFLSALALAGAAQSVMPAAYAAQAKALNLKITQLKTFIVAGAGVFGA